MRWAGNGALPPIRAKMPPEKDAGRGGDGRAALYLLAGLEEDRPGVRHKDEDEEEPEEERPAPADVATRAVVRHK